MEAARAKGYMIELHYVGVDSADLAKERIYHRVQCGGHGIPQQMLIENTKNPL